MNVWRERKRILRKFIFFRKLSLVIHKNKYIRVDICIYNTLYNADVACFFAFLQPLARRRLCVCYVSESLLVSVWLRCGCVWRHVLERACTRAEFFNSFHLNDSVKKKITKIESLSMQSMYSIFPLNWSFRRHKISPTLVEGLLKDLCILLRRNWIVGSNYDISRAKFRKIAKVIPTNIESLQGSTGTMFPVITFVKGLTNKQILSKIS